MVQNEYDESINIKTNNKHDYEKMIDIDLPIIGSHNTMSYLEPIGWIGKLLRFTTRCQRKNYREQYFLYNVRGFDLRIYFDDNGRCWFKHGPVWYKTFSLLEILSFFNEMGDCYVRVTLEETKSDSKKDNVEFAEKRFVSMCRTIEELYPRVKFIGGERRHDWHPLFKFRYEKEHGCPRTLDLYSNTTWMFDPAIPEEDGIFEYISSGWWPWLYAKLKNKKTFKKHYKKRDDIDLFFADYVDIR